MGVQVISELVQKNNRDFPIVDSNNIRGGCYQVSTMEDLHNIPDIRLKVGMLALKILLQAILLQILFQINYTNQKNVKILKIKAVFLTDFLISIKIKLS